MLGLVCFDARWRFAACSHLFRGRKKVRSSALASRKCRLYKACFIPRSTTLCAVRCGYAHTTSYTPAYMTLLNAEGVDSGLVATLQALLTASRFLDRGDSAVVSKAANAALDRAAAAAEATAEKERHPAENARGEAAAGLRRGWPGPNLAALSLLAVLHVSHKRWEGIPAAIDVLQEMVRGNAPESNTFCAGTTCPYPGMASFVGVSFKLLFPPRF